MTNSRAKGCRGERELAKYLRDDLGFGEARRGQQFKGTPDSPDVICPALPGVLIECKRVTGLKPGTVLYDEAWARVCDEAADGHMAPVLFFRQNREHWQMACFWYGAECVIHTLPDQRYVLRNLNERAMRAREGAA